MKHIIEAASNRILKSEIFNIRKLLPQDKIVEIFLKGNPKQYHKFGSVKARLAKVGEKIDTIIDGKIETTNMAKENDVIVTGIKGEKYIIKKDKFLIRYKGPNLSSKDKTYEAIGHCFAIKYLGRSVKFKASWGEEMILNKGDYLISFLKQVMEKMANLIVIELKKTLFLNLTSEKEEEMKHIIEAASNRIVEAVDFDNPNDKIKQILLGFYADAFYNKKTSTWDCFVEQAPIEGRQIRIDGKPGELETRLNRTRIVCKRQLERNGFQTRDTGLYLDARNGYFNLVVKYYVESNNSVNLQK